MSPHLCGGERRCFLLPCVFSANLRRAVVALPLLAVACSVAVAQDGSTGAVNGVVRDASGGVVAGASVALRNVATGQSTTLRTDSLGEFLSVSLLPGRYVLRVSAAQYRSLQMDEVVVAVGQTTRLLPRLQVGDALQQVEVRADAAVSIDSPVNADVSPAQLQALPLDGRRFQTLAALTPLVSAEDSGAALNPEDDPSDATDAGDTDTSQLSVRGQDPSLNRFSLDGADWTRHFDMSSRGGNALPFTVTQEAVQEFAVRAMMSGNETDGGHAAGGVVHTVARRGGEQVHGSAFVFVRNSAADAANPFSSVTHYNGGSPLTTLVKPRDQREQFGGSLGGKLLRNTFGFVAGEGQRRSFPAESTPSEANFYSLTAVQTALLANRGVGAAAIARGLSFLDGLTGTVARHADEFTLFPRLDWDGKRAHAMAEWNHVRFQSPAGQNALPVVARGRGSLGGLATHVDSGGIRGAASVAAWLLEARAGYSRDATFAVTGAPLTQEPHTGSAGAVPEVDLASAFAFGSATASGSRRLPDERVSDAEIKATFNGKAHTVRAGLAVAFVDERVGSREASSGRYSYANSAAAGRAGALVDFLTDATYDAASYPNGGCPSVFAQPHFFCFSNFTQSFGAIAETRFHTVEWSGFAADRWRVTPRLVIEAGTQYEWTRMPAAQHPNSTLDSLFGGFAATGSPPSDTNNLAPHAGVSYALRGSTVLRVSYGYQFATVPGSTIQRALESTAQPASQTTLRLTPRTIVDPACSSYGTNFGYPATYACTPFGPVAAAGAAWMFARGFQMPAVQTAEVSVSQQVAPRTSASATYVLGLSRELTNTVDLNVAPSTKRVPFRIVRNGGEAGARGGDVFNVPLYTARQSTLYGPVTGIVSDGNGTYHALAVSLQHVSESLTVRGSWTWSKSLDTVRTGASSRNENGRFDPFEPLYDRAVSNFDHAHRVLLLGVWQPRVRTDEPWVRRAANGWSLAPVLLVQSGRPYSYNLSGGTALAGGRESLNGSGGANFLPSVGRNTLRLPWTETLDLRVSRVFGFHHDRFAARLSGEAFNLFNHVNPTTVEQRAFLVGTAGADGVVPLTFQDAATLQVEGLSGRAFGVPSASANSVARERRLQVGLRLEW